MQAQVPDEKQEEEKNADQVGTADCHKAALRAILERKKESAPHEDAATAPSDTPLRRLRTKNVPKDATAKIIAGPKSALRVKRKGGD